MHNQQVLNLLAYDEVFLSGIYGMDGGGEDSACNTCGERSKQEVFHFIF